MFEYLHQLIPNSQKRARLSSATAQTAHLTCCPPSLPALAMVSLASSSEFSPFPVSVLFVPVSGSVGSYSIILVLVGFILVIVVEFEPAVVVFVLEMVVFVLEMVVFVLEVLLFELEATVLITC